MEFCKKNGFPVRFEVRLDYVGRFHRGQVGRILRTNSTIWRTERGLSKSIGGSTPSTGWKMAGGNSYGGLDCEYLVVHLHAVLTLQPVYSELYLTSATVICSPIRNNILLRVVKSMNNKAEVQRIDALILDSSGRSDASPSNWLLPTIPCFSRSSQHLLLAKISRSSQ